MVARYSFFAAFLVLAPLSGGAEEQAAPPLAVGNVSSGDHMHLREWANSKSLSLVQIPHDGVGLMPTGRRHANEDETWIEVVYQGKKGWVDSRFVTPALNTNEPVLKVPPTEVSRAKPKFDSTAECDSDDVEHRVRGCSELLKRADLDAAVRAIAFSRRSDAYLAMNDVARALHDRAEALQLDAGDLNKRRLADAYRLRANERQEKKELNEAFKDYERAIQLEPQNVLALVGRASLHLRKDRSDDAITDLQTALAAQPTNAAIKTLIIDIYVQRGSMALAQNRHAAAVADLTQAIKLDAGNALAYLRRGAALAAKNDDAALSDLTEAIRLNPSLKDAYFRRAHVYMSTDKYHEAVADLSDVLRLDASNRDALLRRALALEYMGEDFRANMDYRSVLAGEATNEEAQRAVKRLERKEALQQALIDPNAGNVDAGAAGETYWNHNGSTMKLVADGSRRRFLYEDPKAVLREVGVDSGTLLFDGTRTGNSYTGTARLFSPRCGVVRYKVRGNTGEDQRSVVLSGRAPQLGASCNVVGYRDDTLMFFLMQE